jgi:hypothetical protein
MNSRPSRPGSLLLVSVLSILAVAACGGGAGQSPPVASAAPPAGSPSAGSPSAPGGGNGDRPSGGPGDPGGGDPGAGQATIVVPRPGQLNTHAVGVTLLEAAVDGRHVTVRISWYSGVEPCYVLDSVKVDEGANEFVLTVIEGTSDPNAACIEIAMYKATIVDLGELAAGTWTIRASQGDAQPISVTVA